MLIEVYTLANDIVSEPDEKNLCIKYNTIRFSNCYLIKSESDHANMYCVYWIFPSPQLQQSSDME